MRQIKFRAWDKNSKKMYTVGNIHLLGETWVAPSKSEYAHKDNAWTVGERCELMQFTSLKDKNDKDIFEGDILVGGGYPFFDEGKRNYVAVVEWVFAGFHTILQCVNANKQGISHGVNSALEEGRDFQVIGNIHENPELLEVKK